MADSVEPPEKATPNDKIKFVGERNAIIFHVSAEEPPPPLDLPDEFFDLKQDDVRLLYREMKETRERMEKMPFLTKAVREMEENSATLRRLNRYTQTVLRVQLPERFVLQAVFNHSETVQTVMDFLRQFLDPSDVQFQLYTAPPKCILQPDKTLVETNLTPRALVYLNASQPTCLKAALTTSLSNPRLASDAALQYKRDEPKEDEPEKFPVAPDCAPSTSGLKSGANTSAKSSKASTTVPKWFKR